MIPTGAPHILSTLPLACGDSTDWQAARTSASEGDLSGVQRQRDSFVPDDPLSSRLFLLAERIGYRSRRVVYRADQGGPLPSSQSTPVHL